MEQQPDDPLQFGTTSPLHGPGHEADEHFGGYGDVPLGSVDNHLEAASHAAPAAPAAAAAAAADPLSAEAGAAAATDAAPSAPPAPAAAASPLHSSQHEAPAPQQQPPPQQQPQPQQEAAGAKAPGLYPAVPPPAAAPLPRPPQPEPVGSAELRISVHSPTTLRGPTGLPGLDESFTSFEVTTATSLPSFRASQATVRRRFKDVVALSRLLPSLLPGVILPARPGRNFVEGRLRMSPAFVEQRRAAMERYLNRLAAHPTVARSEALRVWLEADGTLRSSPAWLALRPQQPTPVQATTRLVKTLAGVQRAAPTPAEAARPPAASRDIYRLLHERVAAMRGVMDTAPVGPEEERLRDDGAVVEDLREALQAAVAKADAWARACSDLSAIWGDLGAALEGLATFEGTYASVGAQPTAALGAAAGAARGGALQPFRDHAAALPNALAALQQRQRQLLTSATLKRDLDATRSRLQQAQLAPGTKGKKVEELRQAVAGLEASQAAAAAEYERLAGCNSAELAALKAARARELAAATAHLADVARGFEEQAASGWQATAGALPAPQPGVVTAYMAQRFFKP